MRASGILKQLQNCCQLVTNMIAVNRNVHHRKRVHAVDGTIGLLGRVVSRLGGLVIWRRLALFKKQIARVSIRLLYHSGPDICAHANRRGNNKMSQHKTTYKDRTKQSAHATNLSRHG